jgi:triosephosphate isomerase
VHAVLRAQLAAASDKADRMPLLYGGSMKPAMRRSCWLRPISTAA